MSQPNLIDVYSARERVAEGDALLVCAYEDETKFQRARLEGALFFGDFTERLPSLSGRQLIILYCA